MSILSSNNQKPKNIFDDMSLWSLVFSNIVTIFFAVTESWNLLAIVWVYWFQSMIIGLFNFIRILQLKEFSTEGFKINGEPTEPTQGTKIFTSFFFLFHYGCFHLGYLVFLMSGNLTKNYTSSLSNVEFKYVYLSALLFFINHFYSYIYNRTKDTKKQNIGSLMFYPYLRIIPIHFTMVFGATYINSLPLFLFLKTAADATMHIVEHNILRGGELRS